MQAILMSSLEMESCASQAILFGQTIRYGGPSMLVYECDTRENTLGTTGLKIKDVTQ